ncbi:hypothetical protein FOMPIDRAFT_48439, partial [Fomitopsis schrenkii]
MNLGTDDDESLLGSLVPLDELPATKAQLPLEVWEHILDYLNDDREALRMSSLTCRAWLPMARRHLFARIEL